MADDGVAVVVERPDHIAHVADVVEGLLQHPHLAHALPPLQIKHVNTSFLIL